MLLISGLAYAQPQRQIPFDSPEVHADNTVTFRYFAPNASEVKLNAQFEKQQIPMTKEASGVWSV